MKAPGNGEPRWGLRVNAPATNTATTSPGVTLSEPGGLIYTGRKSAGDMDITLELDSDKLEGPGLRHRQPAR